MDGLVSGGVDDVWTSGVSFLQTFMGRNHSSCHDFQWQVNQQCLSWRLRSSKSGRMERGWK